MKILSTEGWTFWEENGYVVVPNAAPRENLQAVIDAIWAFTGKNPDNPEEWYQEPTVGGGMVNMNHNQALWNNRQYPRIHQAYTDIWGTEKLWITYDRANMNPPVGERWSHGGFIHWDLDVTQCPINLCVQGVLYLTDTAEDQGGFQCVPGSHRRVIEWGAKHPPGRHPTVEEIINGLETQSIAGKAGDLLIWHSALLHGNGRNTSNRPRFAQYVAMTPEWTQRTFRGAVKADENARQARIKAWRDAPCQRAVADAIGVAEGFVEQWLRRIQENVYVEIAAEEVVRPVEASGVWEVKIGGDSYYIRNHAIDGADDTSLFVQRRYAERVGIPYTAVQYDRAIETVRKIPKPRFTPRLADAQLGALPDILAEEKAWNAKGIADIMAQAFGLTHDSKPAGLSELGRKLVGVDAW